MIPIWTSLLVSALVAAVAAWLMHKKHATTGRGHWILTGVVSVVTLAIFFGITLKPCYLTWGYVFNVYPENFVAEEIQVIDDAYSFYCVVKAIADDAGIVGKMGLDQDADHDGIDDALEVKFGFDPHKRTMVQFKDTEPRRIIHTIQATVVTPTP